MGSVRLGDLFVRPARAVLALVGQQEHLGIANLVLRRLAGVDQLFQSLPLFDCQLDNILLVHLRSPYLWAYHPLRQEDLQL